MNVETNGGNQMDALKIISEGSIKAERPQFNVGDTVRVDVRIKEGERERIQALDRKSTRLNSSHVSISYAVFCLKKKTKKPNAIGLINRPAATTKILTNTCR